MVKLLPRTLRFPTFSWFENRCGSHAGRSSSIDWIGIQKGATRKSWRGICGSFWSNEEQMQTAWVKDIFAELSAAGIVG